MCRQTLVSAFKRKWLTTEPQVRCLPQNRTAPGVENAPKNLEARCLPQNRAREPKESRALAHWLVNSEVSYRDGDCQAVSPSETLNLIVITRPIWLSLAFNLICNAIYGGNCLIPYLLTLLRPDTGLSGWKRSFMSRSWYLPEFGCCLPHLKQSHHHSNSSNDGNFDY